MSKLSAKERKAIPSSEFAGPNRSFPIEDESHARAALSMAHYADNPGAIRRKVAQKYPNIEQEATKRAIKGKK